MLVFDAQVLPLKEINEEYDGKSWWNLDNMQENQAKSRYFAYNYRKYAWSKKNNTSIDGEIVVASWDPDPEKRPDLHYGNAETVPVDKIECTGEDAKGVESANVYLGTKEWGNVSECGAGPDKIDNRSTGTPPAIILTSSMGQVHVVVEEVGTHPSFLYSVWNAANVTSKELEYTFHISSTVRLAEAVVTGIVHGETTGGGCFGMLRAFSKGNETEGDPLRIRAAPFGEKPEPATVESLQDVEIIDSGVLVNANALVAFVCLLLLSLVGIGWSMCLRSSADTEVDVYDR